MGSGDVSFDKVFAVPQAPGHLNIADSISDGHDGHDKSTESSDSSVDEQKDSNDKEGMSTQLQCLYSQFEVSKFLKLIFRRHRIS